MVSNTHPVAIVRAARRCDSKENCIYYSKCKSTQSQDTTESHQDTLESILKSNTVLIYNERNTRVVANVCIEASTKQNKTTSKKQQSKESKDEQATIVSYLTSKMNVFCKDCHGILYMFTPIFELSSNLWEQLLDDSDTDGNENMIIAIQPLVQPQTLPVATEVTLQLTHVIENGQNVSNDRNLWSAFDMFQRPANILILQHFLAHTIQTFRSFVSLQLPNIHVKFFIDNVKTTPNSSETSTTSVSCSTPSLTANVGTNNNLTKCMTCHRQYPMCFQILSSDLSIELKPPLILFNNNQTTTSYAAPHKNHNEVSLTDTISPSPQLSPVGFQTLGGCETIMQELRDIFIVPLMFPQIFQHFGAVPPKGVLLYGPPGTGKTHIARALATELQVHWNTLYQEISASKAFHKHLTNHSPPPPPSIELVSGGQFSDTDCKKLNDVFQRARCRLSKFHTSTLILFDEIDSICGSRHDITTRNDKKGFLGSLLTNLDGLQTTDLYKNETVYGGIVVLATTNKPDDLDLALRRAGRFDREIEVGVPNACERELILRKMLESMPHDLTDHDIQLLSSECQAFVAADMKTLCSEAALIALHDFSVMSSNTPITTRTVEDTTDVSMNMKSYPVKLKHFLDARKKIRPSGMKEIVLEVPHVNWDDIGGYSEAKRQLQECVEWPIKYREAFLKLKVTPPRGILLYGPPGCSKTLMAKAVATQSKMNFIPVKGPELLSMWFGESERAVREVFRKARLNSPCVIFFDEIDAIGGDRQHQSGSGGVEGRVLSQMLNEMDGIEAIKQVIVIGATNRPDLLDAALLRPGRLDRLVYIPLPNNEARKEILQVHLKGLTNSFNVNDYVNELATKTEGLTGAELAMLCRESAMLALRESIEINNIIGATTVTPIRDLEVQIKHIKQCLLIVKPRIPKSLITFYENYHHKREKPLK